MAGYLQLAQAARAANSRLRSARELEARWKALGPEGQEEARAEWANVKASIAAVGDRVAAGPKGFVRGFSAAYKGEEVEDVPDPRPLGELVRELHTASEALREKLDAIPGPEDPETTEPPSPAARPEVDAGPDDRSAGTRADGDDALAPADAPSGAAPTSPSAEDDAAGRPRPTDGA